jgi:hypothetical protein
MEGHRKEITAVLKIFARICFFRLKADFREGGSLANLIVGVRNKILRWHKKKKNESTKCGFLKIHSNQYQSRSVSRLILHDLSSSFVLRKTYSRIYLFYLVK